jgi:hypothetical protein
MYNIDFQELGERLQCSFFQVRLQGTYALSSTHAFGVLIYVGIILRTTYLLCTCLFGVVFDVVALQFDKLLKTESAQGNTAARVLPACPGEVL